MNSPKAQTQKRSNLEKGHRLWKKKKKDTDVPPKLKSTPNLLLTKTLDQSNTTNNHTIEKKKKKKLFPTQRTETFERCHQEEDLFRRTGNPLCSARKLPPPPPERTTKPSTPLAAPAPISKPLRNVGPSPFPSPFIRFFKSLTLGLLRFRFFHSTWTSLLHSLKNVNFLVFDLCTLDRSV